MLKRRPNQRETETQPKEVRGENKEPVDGERRKRKGTVSRSDGGEGSRRKCGDFTH